ncbi:MAG: saccharopine dehydrogenase NADP-binding domain-containing protein [Acidobacteria bacterium]|nr:saccharopine dehydrogenase NADP-binding domain-containing protein [Acidobacteriota bacterium]
MGYRYGVLGAGRQGIASAYDFARFGSADEVVLADRDGRIAEAAAARINALVGRPVASARTLDAGDRGALTSFMRGLTACISGVHYTFNLEATRQAIEAGAHLCDFGGHTGVVLEQRKLDGQAKGAGVTVVPDCGMGPGLNISLATHVMALVEAPREVLIWDGGLPQHPDGPWNYASTFNIGGLTNEYYGNAMFIRNGRVTPVPCFSDLEPVDFPDPIGRLEAFVTSGGLSTAPWTFEGTLERLENKTLRYPGHCAAFKAFSQLGLYDEQPVEVGGLSVVPRDVFHALLGPQIGRDVVVDVCVMRVKCVGETGGRLAVATVELIDRYDPATGFTAMQRLTGWHASIVAIAAAQGKIRPGVVPVESCLPGATIVEEGRRRGFAISERVELG